MLLPVGRVDAGVFDRVPAVDHHPVAYINPHMAGPAGVVGALEEDQVPRPCVRFGHPGALA